jgi:CMP-N,N'-diacetyllegionaminic acid synthase
VRVLALIPARGGSKRLPGKNYRMLGGKPLIVWSIDAAKGNPEICDILVSTDDPAIAAISIDSGAHVPWIRPEYLSTDTANSVDVALHALDWYESENGMVDGLLLLQPTSPFRSPNAIQNALEIFRTSTERTAVVSLSPAKTHPAWCFRSTCEGMEPYLGWSAIGRRAQNLEPAWMLNGSIYLVSPALLRTGQTFLHPKFKPLFMEDFAESVDIDTHTDFALCEEILRNTPQRR